MQIGNNTGVKHRVLILGAGRIGRCIAKALAASGQYRVLIGDRSAAALESLTAFNFVSTLVIDVENYQQLQAAMQDQQAVLSACSFDQNTMIAEAAMYCGISYFDLTEDVETTRFIRQLAARSREGQIFMPQCGLAPGFIGILANDVAQQFDEVHALKLRVGALPEYPSNHLMYNLTWSTEGLINEYCNPCESIRDGKRIEVLALEGLETFSLDGVEYEAFNTSGGLGTLCETWQARARELNYKTVRYPGHCYLMHFLINDLRLGEVGERREMLKQIFESSVAGTHQDLVLILVIASGMLDGQLMQVTELYKVYHDVLLDENWSAIQLTTALSACVVIDLFFKDQLPGKGFVKQEDVKLEKFTSSEFAFVFRREAQS